VFDFLDVAQVEVLRGPQGTLYGKNTTAGAINIRTNQPTFDFEGSAEISLGNYDFKQAKAAVSGPLARPSRRGSRSRRPTAAARSTMSPPATGSRSRTTSACAGSCCGARATIVDVTLTGDFSSQQPECCGTVYVGYGPTQRALARQFPALAAAQNYAPAAPIRSTA
jgi:iron complex outermembrane receptor protein